MLIVEADIFFVYCTAEWIVRVLMPYLGLQCSLVSLTFGSYFQNRVYVYGLLISVGKSVALNFMHNA